MTQNVTTNKEVLSVFLKLKHWQLFGILFGLPVIFQLVITGTLASNGDFMRLLWGLVFGSSRVIDILLIIPHPFVTAFTVVTVLFIGLIFCWLYSLGVNLPGKLPETAKMKSAGFKICLIISAICKIFTSVYLYFVFSGIVAGGELNTKIFVFAIPLYLFSMCCTFYCFYFIAKTLKCVERQTPVTFSDCALEFFSVWISPIGIWFIQPKINRLFENLPNDNLK
jgi:hypothetical protein